MLSFQKPELGWNCRFEGRGLALCSEHRRPEGVGEQEAPVLFAGGGRPWCDGRRGRGRGSSLPPTAEMSDLRNVCGHSGGNTAC